MYTNFFLGETGIHIGHSLLEEALCFSYLFRSTSKSYQRLEYVGDSVLDFFVSDFLFRISNLSSISRKLNLLPTLSKGAHDTLPIKKLGYYLESFIRCCFADVIQTFENTKSLVHKYLDLRTDKIQYWDSFSFSLLVY
ncbi:hypothetical protein ACTFIR_001205 [Dictyostelium discoideum]